MELILKYKTYKNPDLSEILRRPFFVRGPRNGGVWAMVEVTKQVQKAHPEYAMSYLNFFANAQVIQSLNSKKKN